MNDVLEFGILGPFTVERNGAAIDVPPGKPRALLAILLLHRRKVVPVDRLVEELWGERPPASAAKNVQVYVARLRKVLGDGVLVTSPPGYALQLDDEQLDAARFELLVRRARREDPPAAAEQLGEAMALWRGSPLADFTYESFAQSEIRRLDELRLEALEDRIDADLTLGRHEDVVAELEHLAEANPLRERMQAHLMLALYRSGRQADALAAYQRTRRHFVDELGLEPSPPLHELEQAILRHDPALASPERVTVTPRHRKRPPRTRLLVFSGVLVLAGVASLVGVRMSSGSRKLVATPNSVGVIDGKRAALHAVVSSGGTPGGIASGEGAVWVTDTADDVVLRIDPVGRTAERVPVGHGPTGVAVGDREVWVVNQLDRTVSEINPRALKQVNTFPVGNGASAAAYGDGSLWVADTTDNAVSRIDPNTGHAVQIDLGAGVPQGIAVGKEGVWVTSSTGELLLIDPDSNRVSAYPIGNGAAGVAVGAGRVWVANTTDGTVSRFDPGTAEVRKIPVGSSPSGVAYGAGAVWVANSLDGTVTRIDPQTSATRPVRVGNEPTALAIAGKTLWATVLPSPASHRGGTLRVWSEPSFPGLGFSADPATFHGVVQWQMLSLTNDGLVTYRRVGGLAGDRLVPDLATSLPEPTDGGRTYTFHLRTGIRYSNGEVVEPGDFRRSIERIFRLPAATQLQKGPRSYIESFYTGIVGAAQCRHRPHRCDLRRGIVTDDKAHTVTFRLTAPDTDFLYKLAFPMADATPAGTPDHDIGTTPLPATGPYKTGSFSADHSWVLVRNPRFHVWSPEAQPDGFPDRIVLRPYRNPRQAVNTVEHGSADVLQSVPSGRLGELSTRYANLLHSDPSAATYALTLNTRVPPFDRLAVRRALNYAIDRGRIVGFAGGPLIAKPTCQILPPTLAGYRPYCPYTTGPNSGGSWTAPDLARARQLVAESGTRGMKVTLWLDTTQGGPQPQIGKEVVSLLDQLGYRASQKVVRFVTPGPASDSRTRAQMGFFTWLQDYASPSSFIAEVLTCRSFAPRSPSNPNLSEFCSPKIDAQIRRAYVLHATDPAAEGNLWVRIDHKLVDQAPWVPLYNPRALTALSARVGNYQYHPFWQVMLDQLWVR